MSTKRVCKSCHAPAVVHVARRRRHDIFQCQSCGRQQDVMTKFETALLFGLVAFMIPGPQLSGHPEAYASPAYYAMVLVALALAGYAAFQHIRFRRDNPVAQ